MKLIIHNILLCVTPISECLGRMQSGRVLLKDNLRPRLFLAHISVKLPLRNLGDPQLPRVRSS